MGLIFIEQEEHVTNQNRQEKDIQKEKTNSICLAAEYFADYRGNTRFILCTG